MRAERVGLYFAAVVVLCRVGEDSVVLLGVECVGNCVAAHHGNHF